MDIVYAIIPKSQINNDLLIICSNLFNNSKNWYSKGINQDKIDEKIIQEYLLFDNNCGITQLVIKENITDNISAMLIHSSFDPDCQCCGLITPYSYCIMLLEKAM